MQRLIQFRNLDNRLQIFGQYLKPQIYNRITTQTDLLNAKSFDSIPGITSVWSMMVAAYDYLPIVGKHRGDKMRISDVHFEAYKTYGKIYRINILPNLKLVIINDPDEIQKVFQQDGKFPKRRMLDLLRIYRNENKEKYSSAGILIENNEKWYNTRIKVQQPMLKPQLVDKYMDKMAKVSDDFVALMKAKRGKNGEIPNYLNEIYKWALESIGLITFNTRLGCLENNLSKDSEPHRMITAANGLFEAASLTEYGPKLWLWYAKWTRNYKKLEKYCETVHNIVTKHIDATKQQLKDKSIDEVDMGILESILQKDIDSREVTTFMFDLLVAGIDTTSHSMGSLLYLMAKNPDKQEILHREIKTVLKNNKGKISRDTIDSMPYIKGCIQESMRLMPVTEGTTRYFDHDIVLNGYRIPAGTHIIVSVGLTGKLPEYFEEPRKFKPERWLQGAKKPNPYAYLPFGSGPRSCIGRRIAFLELQLLLIKIIEKFKVEYHYEDIGMKTRFVNMPDKPLKFKFIDRE